MTCYETILRHLLAQDRSRTGLQADVTGMPLRQVGHCGEAGCPRRPITIIAAGYKIAKRYWRCTKALHDEFCRLPDRWTDQLHIVQGPEG